MTISPEQHLIKHLEDVHAIELALVQTLTAHIAVTPKGDYRDLLERHLGETTAQASALQDRLRAHGSSAGPVELVRGVVTAVVGQALAAAKGPIDLLRGPSLEEKLLRNARDESATEALEIAAYDALEAIAEAAGDPKTATLAREHRTQEERMLRDLRDVIPSLARAAFGAEVHDEHDHSAGDLGAVQAAKSVARDTAGKLRGRDGGSVTTFGADAIAAMTVEDALKAIDDVQDGGELGRIEAAERTGRNRKRVLDRLRSRREQLAGV